MYTKFVWAYELSGKVDWWSTRISNVRFACGFSRFMEKLTVSQLFFLPSFLALFVAQTHTVTHTGTRTETAEYFRVGSSSRFVFSDLLSHDLAHEIPHLFCGLFLLLAGGVGVGA